MESRFYRAMMSGYLIRKSTMYPATRFNAATHRAAIASGQVQGILSFERVFENPTTSRRAQRDPRVAVFKPDAVVVPMKGNNPRRFRGARRRNPDQYHQNAEGPKSLC